MRDFSRKALAAVLADELDETEKVTNAELDRILDSHDQGIVKQAIGMRRYNGTPIKRSLERSYNQRKFG